MLHPESLTWPKWMECGEPVDLFCSARCLEVGYCALLNMVMNMPPIIKSVSAPAASLSHSSNGISNSITDSKRPGLWARFKNNFTGASNRHVDITRGFDLVGKTIDPKVASDYFKNLTLSGTGEIIEVRNLSEQKYHVVLNHIISPLSLTPGPRETVVRTPGECVIDALVAVRATVDDRQLLRNFDHVLRATWLDGSLSRQGALNALSLVRRDAGRFPALIQQIDRIESSMEKCLYITRRNDNLYGRLFETHLAEFLVKNPDESMLLVRDSVAEFMRSDLLAYKSLVADSLAKEIAQLMGQDPAPWRAAIPEVRSFLASPNKKSLEAMLGCKGDKSVSLLLSVAVKYTIKAPGLAGLLNRASAFYMAVIVGQRNLIGGPRAKLQTDMHGLLLPYQRGAHPSAATAEGVGVRPMDKYVRPDPDTGMTSHDWNAVVSERTIGIGMSGSSNILDFVFRDISSKNPDFPATSARMAAAAWVAHSGGHSFNEVYSVFGYGQNKDFSPISFNGLELESFTAHEAVDYAFSKVVIEAERLYGMGPEA